MTSIRKLFLTVVAIACAAAFTAGTATAARSLSVSGGTNITAVASALSFTGNETENRVIAPVTLTGTLRQGALPKGERLLGIIRTCRTGRGTTNIGGTVAEIRCELTLNWNVEYETFFGTLPEITGILLTLRTPGFLIETRAFGIRANACLYGGSTIGVTTNGPEVTDLIPQRGRDTSRLVTILNEALAACDREGGRLEGTFRLTAAQRLRLL